MELKSNHNDTTVEAVEESSLTDSAADAPGNDNIGLITGVLDTKITGADRDVVVIDDKDDSDDDDDDPYSVRHKIVCKFRGSRIVSRPHFGIVSLDQFWLMHSKKAHRLKLVQ